MSLLRFLLILPVALALAFPMPAQTVDPKLAAMLQHTLDSMRTVLQVKGLSAAVQLPNDAVWAGFFARSHRQPAYGTCLCRRQYRQNADRRLRAPISGRGSFEPR